MIICKAEMDVRANSLRMTRQAETESRLFEPTKDFESRSRSSTNHHWGFWWNLAPTRKERCRPVQLIGLWWIKVLLKGYRIRKLFAKMESCQVTSGLFLTVTDRYLMGPQPWFRKIDCWLQHPGFMSKFKEWIQLAGLYVDTKLKEIKKPLTKRNKVMSTPWPSFQLIKLQLVNFLGACSFHIYFVLYHIYVSVTMVYWCCSFWCGLLLLWWCHFFQSLYLYQGVD